MPIKDLRNTNEITNMTHREQKHIFITNNEYSEFQGENTRMDPIDQAIFESENEIAKGAKAVDAEIVFTHLQKKYFG